MGFLLLVICSGCPIELDKPHIWALATETGFLLFKEQVPFKFKKEISAVLCEKEDLLIDITFNPCQFSLESPCKLGLSHVRMCLTGHAFQVTLCKRDLCPACMSHPDSLNQEYRPEIHKETRIRRRNEGSPSRSPGSVFF